MPQSLPIEAYDMNRQGPPMRAASRRRIMQLIPLLAVFYSVFLLPPEVEFAVFGINFPSYRIAMLLVSVPALWSSLRSRTATIPFMDVAVMVIGFWTMLSFITIYGFEVGLVRGAGLTIDTVLPYFIARTCIRSLDDLRYFLILILPAIAVAGLTLIAESLSGRLLLRPAFASVFGNMSKFGGGETSGSLVLEDQYRLGLLRAYGPFPHPILAGIMMIGFLPLYFFSGLRSWPWIGGILLALTGFFGLSSAAFLALIVAVGGVVIHQVKAYVPRISWWTISGLLILALWTLHMLTKNGIISVISRLTLSPDTAEYRVNIWHWGFVNIEKHPWFGIGYKQWERFSWMVESVDAHFLLLAMRHGIVVPVMMLAAIFYGIVRLGLIIPNLAPKDREFVIGINICMIIFLIVGQTVNYYGSANILLMSVIAFLASAGVWGHAQMQASKRERMMIQRSQMIARAAA